MKHLSLRNIAVIALTAIVAAAAGLLAGGDTASGQAGEAPRNTAVPTIAGTLEPGQTLQAAPGSWTGTQPIEYTYQWSRCSAQMSDCAIIAGATRSTYTLTSTDVGKRMLVVVTATNTAGRSTAQASSETVGVKATGPANTALPTISGTATAGQTLTATAGTWTGTAPISNTYQWQRCNATGAACTPIAGATSSTYVLQAADVGSTLRVAVTARNEAGSQTATSGQTSVIAPAGPAGQIKLPNGLTSIPAASVALPARLVIDRVSFPQAPIRSRQPFTATFRVVDTRGYAVRDALVFVRSTPLVTTTPGEQATGQDGTVTLQIQPEPSFRLANGYSVQFFVRARKQGDNLLAGVSTRRLVQVRTASAAR
jgi:hypothetical protein